MKNFIARLRVNETRVVAYLALFIALGGVSYAAVSLPKNSVGTKQLKKNAVVSSKVKNGSLRRADFGAGQIPAGPTGATGPDGSPDTPQQVLDKIKQVDGVGSGLDADSVAGMPSSSIGTLGSEASGFCGDDSHVAGGQICTTTTLTLPRAGRVLLNASGYTEVWLLDDSVGSGSDTDDPTFARGRCGLSVNGDAPSHFNEAQQYHRFERDPFAITDLTASLPAGQHTFMVKCSETDGDIDFYSVHLTAVMIGDG